MTMRVMIFIDGTWLWHNMMYQNSCNGTKIDLSQLPNLIVDELAKRLGTMPEYVGTILCASIPKNTHFKDVGLVSKRRHFFEVLKDKCGYTIELFEIDFRGHRLLKQDRGSDTWSPKEKCVDIATAINILYYANNYDLAIVVTGDRDFLPALNKVRALGKQVEIASFENSCSKELVTFSSQLVWIDSFLPKLLLRE